jgi:hypothetical protein
MVVDALKRLVAAGIAVVLVFFALAVAVGLVLGIGRVSPRVCPDSSTRHSTVANNRPRQAHRAGRSSLVGRALSVRGVLTDRRGL